MTSLTDCLQEKGTIFNCKILLLSIKIKGNVMEKEKFVQFKL